MGDLMADSTALQYGIALGTDENDDTRDEIQNEHALVEAAARGDYEKILELLYADVSVDAEEYNKLLFYASKDYVTPLQIAASNGHDKCVQLLIDHNADVNAKDRFDVTALHMAAEKGHFLCVKALLDAGADCCVRTKFSKSGCYTAVPHLGGTNPLHLAAANNHVSCVRELIQYGADYNAVDEYGRTSLYIAAQAGFDECVLAHLKNAVGRDILSLPSFDTSDTPLHFAVSRGMVQCVKELLRLGSDVNHINLAGYSPLHLAITPISGGKQAKRMKILKLLILEGYDTDVNLPDDCGFTPLHYVCFNGLRNLWSRRPEMAKFLISYGADVNIRNNSGISLLELELKSSERSWDILKYMVKSMLHLPPLKSMNINLQRERFPSTSQQQGRIGNNGFQGRNGNNGLQGRNINDPGLQRESNQVMPQLNERGRGIGHAIQMSVLMHHWRVRQEMDQIQRSLNDDHDPQWRNRDDANEMREGNEGFNFNGNLPPGHPMRNDYRNAQIVAQRLQSWPNVQNERIFDYNGRGPQLPPLFPNVPNNPAEVHPVFPRPPNTHPIEQQRQNAAQQPLLMHVYDAIENIMDAEMSDPDSMEEDDIQPQPDTQSDTRLVSSYLFRKQCWYERLSTNARTLQHCCRYTIRKHMGARKLKHITKLPIPSRLQSYLLLQSNE